MTRPTSLPNPYETGEVCQPRLQVPDPHEMLEWLDRTAESTGTRRHEEPDQDALSGFGTVDFCDVDAETVCCIRMERRDGRFVVRIADHCDPGELDVVVTRARC